MREDEREALERFRAAQALAELKRRHPNEDWGNEFPCPDCGSMFHFECDGSGNA